MKLHRCILLSLVAVLPICVTRGGGEPGTEASSTDAATKNGTAAQAHSPIIPLPMAARLTGVSASDGHSVFSIGMNWNESVRHVSVSVPSSFPGDVTVLGVQGSSDVFVTDFPRTIPAGGTAEVHLLVMAGQGGESSTENFRILTTGGILSAELQRSRSEVAQFNATNLKWSLGGAAEPQTVRLTMTPGTAVPIGVHAFGPGNSATISSDGDGVYTISVTPASTARAETFPVIVTFNPVLPGVSGAIGCQVQ